MKMRMLAVVGLMSFSGCIGADVPDEAGLVQVDPATGAVVRTDVDGVLVRVERDGATIDFTEAEPGVVAVSAIYDATGTNPLAGYRSDTSPLEVFESLTSVAAPVALHEALAHEPLPADPSDAFRSCSAPEILERSGRGDYTSPCNRAHGVILTGSAGPEDEVVFFVERKKLGDWNKVLTLRVPAGQALANIVGGRHLARRQYHVKVGTEIEESWSFKADFE